MTVPAKTNRFHDAVVFVALALVLAAATVDAQGRPRVVPLPAPNATLETQFTAISAIRELSDGRVLVADQGEKKLYVVDWTSGEATEVGRNGSGPGEFQLPTNLLALRGDSTLLVDAPGGRWLLLHGASIVTTIPPSAPAIRAGARLPVGADSRGHVLFTRALGALGNGMVSRAAMPRLDSTALVRVARETGQIDSIGLLRARKSDVRIQGPRDNPTSVEVVSHPLAVAEQGAMFADGWIAIARLEPYRVDWVAPDGRVVQGKPLPFERVPVDQAEQRAFVERESVRTGRPPRDPSSYAQWPEVMPPFLTNGMLPAIDGRLWVRRTVTSVEPVPPYDVIDRSGSVVARVSAGARVRVIGFGRSAVYTVITDEDGLQRLERRASIVLP